MLPTPNIDLDRIPECQKYLAEGSHRRLYRFSPDDYRRWPASGATARWRCPATRPALEVVDGPPEGGKIPDLMALGLRPDYAPEEMFEIATKLYKKSR